jgi:O-antigen/teichoic acid export membrane protein
VATKPKYWPLVTFASVFLVLGVAGLAFDDELDEPTKYGLPLGYAYGAMVLSSVCLLLLAAYLWAKRRQR